jgi:hypothetical protein
LVLVRLQSLSHFRHDWNGSNEKENEEDCEVYGGNGTSVELSAWTADDAAFDVA